MKSVVISKALRVRILKAALIVNLIILISLAIEKGELAAVYGIPLVYGLIVLFAFSAIMGSRLVLSLSKDT